MREWTKIQNTEIKSKLKANLYKNRDFENKIYKKRFLLHNC